MATHKQKKVNFFQDLNVTYNGGSVNKVMVAVMDQLADPRKVDDNCRRLLMQIQALHGADVLSSHYSKLNKVIQHCVKESEGPDDTPASAFTFFLD